MTIVSLLDTPLLRDGDETNNNGIGFYMCGTPRTGVDQTWTGFALYVNRNGTWSLLESSSLPGTIGTIVSASGLSGDTSTFDLTGHFIVDLYGTSATLSSITEADAIADGSKNLAIVGDMIIQFVTATQVAGFPNRWDLSVLLNGRRGTEGYVTDSFTGKRFVLVDGAVKFVPVEISDLNNLLEYRAVTSGQSLGDAATVDFAWTGGTKKPLSIVNARGTRDSGNDLLIEFEGRTRIGGGLRSNQAGAVNEETEEYRVQPVGASRIIPVVPGIAMAAMLESDGATKFTNVTHGTLSGTGAQSVAARSFQRIERSGNFIEANLSAIADVGSGANAVFGVVPSNVEWRNHVFPNLPGHLYLTDICPLLVIVSHSDSGRTVQVNEFNTTVLAAFSVADDIRVHITFSGTETRVSLSWAGQGTPAVYRSSNVPTFPINVLAFITGLSSADSAAVSKITMTTAPFPKTIYASNQQIEDGFTPGNPIQFDIWQYSLLVGDGIKTRVTL